MIYSIEILTVELLCILSYNNLFFFSYIKVRNIFDSRWTNKYPTILFFFLFQFLWIFATLFNFSQSLEYEVQLFILSPWLFSLFSKKNTSKENKNILIPHNPLKHWSSLPCRSKKSFPPPKLFFLFSIFELRNTR